MDKVLKQRLVGASILIALGVIFLPMLFDGGEDTTTQRQLALDLPERPGNGQREVRRLPLDPDQARRVVSESVAEPAEPEERTPEPRPVPEPVAEPEVEPEPQPGPDADLEELAAPEPLPESAPEAPVEPDADGDWVVQVAVFGSEATADRIVDRLEQLGHRTRKDRLVRDAAELFRVQTGPYASREDADTARGQIAATVSGVDPVVREAERAASEGPGARAGYAVQVGSFASQTNAERLVAQLRDQGYDGFMHQESSGGRAIWRVRVGTFDERGAADRMLDELREAMGLEGIVVTHP